MLIRRSPDLTYADVTPKSVYLNRRKFLQGMGLAGGAALVGTRLLDLVSPSNRVYAGTKLTTVKSSFNTDEKITPFDDVTHYNNFYEFGADKSDPAKYAQNFQTSPWSVSVEGEIAKPRTFTMDLMPLNPYFHGITMRTGAPS